MNSGDKYDPPFNWHVFTKHLFCAMHGSRSSATAVNTFLALMVFCLFFFYILVKDD